MNEVHKPNGTEPAPEPIDVDIIEETIGDLSNLLDAVAKPLARLNPELAAKAQKGAAIGRKTIPLVGKVREMAKKVSDATVTRERPIPKR
jgi:hypothetical protein